MTLNSLPGFFSCRCGEGFLDVNVLISKFTARPRTEDAEKENNKLLSTFCFQPCVKWKLNIFKQEKFSFFNVREPQQRHFWATHVHRKWGLPPFYMPWRTFLDSNKFVFILLSVRSLLKTIRPRVWTKPLPTDAKIPHLVDMLSQRCGLSSHLLIKENSGEWILWQITCEKWGEQGRSYLYTWYARAYLKKAVYKKDIKWIDNKKWKVNSKKKAKYLKIIILRAQFASIHSTLVAS